MTEAVYIDTSCLMRLLIREPDSSEVHAACQAASEIVVSSLGELETRSSLLALRRGGGMAWALYRRANAQFDVMLASDPFRVEPLSGEIFEDAIAQLKRRGAVPCKSVDRLHLAAMKLLGLQSILTKDRRQAAVAKALGFTVLG